MLHPTSSSPHSPFDFFHLSLSLCVSPFPISLSRFHSHCKQSAGYGVAGHKNSFSGSIRCGNWVEDAFGAELQAAGPVKSSAADFVTETSENYLGAPAEPTDPNATLAAAGSQCIPRDLLFTHGDLTVVASPFAEYAPFGTEANAYSANALIRKKAEQAAAELAAARGPAASTARTTYTGEMPESQERPKGRDASFSKGFSNGVHVLRR